MPNINTNRLSFLLPAALAALLCGGLPVTAAPTVDPKAQALLKQSAAAYQALHSFSCQVRTELRIGSVPGNRVIKIKLAFQAPDKAAATVDKNDETFQYLSDGASLYVYSPEKKQYLQGKLPPNVPRTAPVLTQGQSFQGLLLIKPSGLTALADATRALSLTLGPPEMLDGLAVRTVTKVMRGKDDGRLTMAVSIGVKDHLVHQYVSTIRSPKPLMPEQGDIRQIDNREFYSDMQTNPALPASTFLPPPDAKKADPDKQDQKQ